MNHLKLQLKKLILRLSKVRYLNRWVILLVDLCLSVLATLLIVFSIETYLRMVVPTDYKLLLGSLVASLLAILICKSYANVIRYATLREVWRLMFMAILKDVLLGGWIIAGNLLSSRVLVFLAADFFVTFVFILFVRILALNVYNAVLLSTYVKKKNVLVYGIGENSVTLSQGGSKVYMSDYVIRGFFVNESKIGRAHV